MSDGRFWLVLISWVVGGVFTEECQLYRTYRPGDGIVNNSITDKQTHVINSWQAGEIFLISSYILQSHNIIDGEVSSEGNKL